MQESIKITDEQWGRYIKKYKNLLWTIANNISGDLAISSPEDNYSDLQIAAMNSIEGFMKKTQIFDFDKIFEMRLFDQYTKTVLWNCKNQKGAKITKRKNIAGPMTHFSDISEDVLELIEDKSASSVAPYEKISGVLSNVDDELKELIDAIVNNPSVVKKSGSLNIQALARLFNESPSKITKKVEKLKRLLFYAVRQETA